jgi:hypothetical protein
MEAVLAIEKHQTKDKHMNTNCDKCGEANPADTHTCGAVQPAPVQVKGYAADGQTELHTLPGVGLVVSAVAFNNLATTPPAAQRQFVGLTDGERNKIRFDYLDYDERAQAIEAKLKEKNNG